MAYFRLAEAKAILAGYIFDALGIQDKVAYCPGAYAGNVLSVPADVVDGETVVIGADTYIVDIINTDLTENTVGALDDGSGGLSLVTATGVHGRVAGDLIRIENEIMKVVRVPSTTTMVCARGRCGTTAATHVTASDIYVSDAVHATFIPVGLVATLTPTVFTAALVQEINNAKAGDERATAKASTVYSAITASLNGVNEVHIKGNTVGVLALATTETLAGANNEWMAATMFGGVAAGRRRFQTFTARVPTAAEVTLAKMFFFTTFTPTFGVVRMTTTATGLVLAYDGEMTFGAGFALLENGGAVDFATTSTIELTVWE
jgi:hypothetical protein